MHNLVILLLLAACVVIVFKVGEMYGYAKGYDVGVYRMTNEAERAFLNNREHPEDDYLR